MVSRVASREAGIDAFRFLLMFLVVFAHAWSFAGPMPPKVLPYLPLIVAHCVVPFFFITSGYFLRWNDGGPFDVTVWSIRKLLPLFCIWFAIYVIGCLLVGLGGIQDLLTSVVHGGPTRHLWFLPALAFALSITSMSLRFVGLRWSWILLGALGVYGLYHGAYQSLLGVAPHPVRGGLLTAPFFVLIGVQIARSDVPRTPVLFGLAILATYVAQVFDDTSFFGGQQYLPGHSPQVTLATIPYSVAVFLFARSIKSGWLVERLSGMKRSVLTIYCIHPMTLFALRPVIHSDGLTGVLEATILGFALSMVAAVMLSAAQQHWPNLSKLRTKFRRTADPRLAKG